MPLRLSPVDRADTAAVDELFALFAADHRPYAGPPRDRGHFGRTVNRTRPGLVARSWLAYDGDRVAGSIGLQLPQHQNTGTALGHLQVHPGLRRRGLGRELYGHLAAAARDEGRDTVIMSHHERVPGGAEGVDPAPKAFLRAMGFTTGMVSLVSRLDLADVPGPGLDALEAGALEHAAGYEPVTWLEGVPGDTPDDLVDDLAHLEYRLTADMPHGDLDQEPERPDADLVRRRAAGARERGVTLCHAGMREKATGRLVAWTFLGLSGDAEEHAHQAVTVVDPAHRGRRLGLLVKLANLTSARERRPRLRTVDTVNAEDNAHMLAVNTAMGFRPRYRDVACQARI